jgi:hypothetical protein
MNFALKVADGVWFMDQRRIVEIGEPESFFSTLRPTGQDVRFRPALALMADSMNEILYQPRRSAAQRRCSRPSTQSPPSHINDKLRA